MDQEMHVAVVANCQARPIASLIKILAPEVDNVSTIVVHLSQKDSAAIDYELLDKADYIFAQFVTDEYAAGHLATSRLKDRYGSKIISWPNIFFRGQQPDLAYASVKRKDGTHIARLMGPLREYHFKSVYRAWVQGICPAECLANLSSSNAAYSDYTLETAALSIKELAKRELGLDVLISDIISNHWQDRRLFFTFNHPTAFLLQMMASRLIEKAGLTYGPAVEITKFGEPLSLVVPPIFARDVPVLGSALGGSATARGVQITFKESAPQFGAACDYSLDDLVEVAYKAYDSSISREDDVRFSPP